VQGQPCAVERIELAAVEVGLGVAAIDRDRIGEVLADPDRDLSVVECLGGSDALVAVDDHAVGGDLDRLEHAVGANVLDQPGVLLVRERSEQVGLHGVRREPVEISGRALAVGLDERWFHDRSAPGFLRDWDSSHAPSCGVAQYHRRWSGDLAGDPGHRER
jgi:hypothetical protein